MLAIPFAVPAQDSPLNLSPDTVIARCGNPTSQRSETHGTDKDRQEQKMLWYKAAGVEVTLTRYPHSDHLNREWQYSLGMPSPRASVVLAHSAVASKLPCIATWALAASKIKGDTFASTPDTNYFSSASSVGSALGGFMILIGAVIAYFVPLWVALARNAKSMGGIFVINLFLGWTILGWIGALAWAASSDPKPKAIPQIQ